MKKILMTLSLALAALIAVPTVNAQDVREGQKAECTNQTCSKDRKECKEKEECKKDEKKKFDNKRKDGRRFQGDKHRQGTARLGRDNALFNGITLTEAQQEQFKALKKQRAEQHKAERAQLKKDKAEKKAIKAEEMKAKRAAYDKEVQKILTPEQYKQFLANQQAMEQSKRGPRR